MSSWMQHDADTTSTLAAMLDYYPWANTLPRFSSLPKSRPGQRALLPRCALLTGAQLCWDMMECTLFYWVARACCS